MKNFFIMNKPIGLYKRLYKIEQVLQKKPNSRLQITLWVDDGTIDETKLITRNEIVKRLRIRRNKIKTQIKTLEKKLGKTKMKQLQKIALVELKQGF